MSDSNSNYHFSPLPAPYPMKWDYLMPPLKRAVYELLKRIEGAEETTLKLNKSDEDKKKEFGNCFLVYGSRGTGKTTVLVSARDASRQNSKFFDDTDYGKETWVKLQEKDLKEKAKQLPDKKLQSIIWLDVLDLEPLHPDANLLATLLTRILSAIESPDSKKECGEFISIFEEGKDSARQKFSQLIHDAALMWGEITETDTRNKANRQLSQADIYAGFRKRFKDAMDQLSKELGCYRRLSDDKGCSIVLPIDNIDRSTDHLRNIVKLTQMVTHRRLWLVMAGDRVEIESFLERLYWKELIDSRGGGDAKGKMRRGEDETLFMARRQAITTSQRLWPSTHRIEIDFVKPREALNFRPPDKYNEETLYELLAKVVIPTTQKQRKAQIEAEDDKKDIYLIELLDIYDKVPLQPFQEDDIKKEPSGNASQISNFTNNCINSIPGCKKLFKDEYYSSFSEKLNAIIRHYDLRKEKWFFNEDIKSKLRPETKARIERKNAKANDEKSKTDSAKMPSLNRMILEDVYPEEIEANACYLTPAAQHGLTLSARSLLDLWRLADWAVNDSTKSSPDFSAEKIARTMLRTAISGSEISSVMGQLLQDDIIRRSEDGGTVISFGELELIQGHLRTPGITVFKKLSNTQPYNIRSKLMIGTMEDVTLSLKRKQPFRTYDTDFKGEKLGYFPQPFIVANESEEQIEELPAPVAAWLTILHDILILAESEVGSTVITSKFEPPQGIVEIDHEIIGKPENFERFHQTLSWPLPKFITFWAYSVFRRRWRDFAKSIMKKFGYQANSEDLPFELLAAGWITCALETFDVFNPIGNFKISDSFSEDEKPTLLAAAKSALDWCYETEVGKTGEEAKRTERDQEIMNFDKQAMKAAARIYFEILNMESTPPPQEVDAQDDIQGLRVQMRDWLENKLPYLISYLYVPTQVEYPETRCTELVKHILGQEENKAGDQKKYQELANYWKNNSLFILYEFEKELLKFIPDIKKYPSTTTSSEKYKESLKLIKKYFNDLYRLGEEVDTKPKS